MSGNGRDHESSCVDTWSVLKTPRTDSVYALQFSFTSCSCELLCDTWTIFISLLFFFTDESQISGSFIQWFRLHFNIKIICLCIDFFPWSHILFFFMSRRGDEWMANEHVPKTSFDSGDNKDALRRYKCYYIHSAIPVLLWTFWKFSMERSNFRKRQASSCTFFSLFKHFE